MSFYFVSLDQKSIDKLVEASTAEAEAVSIVWRAAQEALGVSAEKDLSQENESAFTADDQPNPSDSDDTLQLDVKLHPRAVCYHNCLFNYSLLYISIFICSDDVAGCSC